MLQPERPFRNDLDHEIMRCVLDEDGHVVFMSPALAWTLGINGQHALNKPATKIMGLVAGSLTCGKDDDPSALLALESGFHEIVLYRRGRDPLLVDGRVDNVTSPDGRGFTVFWLDPEKTSQPKDPAEYSQIATQLADIACRFSQRRAAPRRKQARAKKGEVTHISQADGELRHFLNLSNDLLGVYRRDGTFERVNYAFNRVLGYTDDDLRQFPFIELIHPEDREAVTAHMQKVVEASPDEETRVDFESRARCKDGSYRWMEWIQKSIGAHIYIVGRDVTAAKQHEAELEWREQQLSEAQKIGRMGHWHWIVGDDSIEWSDQIYNIFGVEKGRFIPTLENINSRLSRRDVGSLFRSFKRALVEKRDYSIEFSLHHPSGGMRYIRCDGRCQINAKTGEVEALFGIMQDITERTLHERALREAKDAAESAYASKTRFLANMSHELRTPLNAIIGFSEMMQRQLLGPLGNERYMDYIAGVRESGEHLLDLINDILDMSKIEIGKYELEAEEVNVGKLVRLAVHMMEGRAHEGPVRLISDNIPEDTQIIADRRALMQILLNLMSNAIKFTEPEGSVEISCRKERGGVAIIVTDTGVGIPQDKIDLVTLPFEQVGSEMTRKYEGSGLGLAITKDLVELHGGRLEIESEVGAGTTVRAILPDVAAGIGAGGLAEPQGNPNTVSDFREHADEAGGGVASG